MRFSNYIDESKDEVVEFLYGQSFYKGTVVKVDKKKGKTLVKLAEPNNIAKTIWVDTSKIKGK